MKSAVTPVLMPALPGTQRARRLSAEASDEVFLPDEGLRFDQYTSSEGMGGSLRQSAFSCYNFRLPATKIHEV